MSSAVTLPDEPPLSASHSAMPAWPSGNRTPRSAVRRSGLGCRPMSLSDIGLFMIASVLCLTMVGVGHAARGNELGRVFDSQLDHPTCGDLGAEDSMTKSSDVLDRLCSIEMPSLVADKLEADPS